MDFLRNLFGKKQPADTSSAIADENTVFLQAEPISRKRMDLLWIDPPQLAQLQQQLAQHTVITVVDSSNLRDYKITQEDYKWAKQIERVVDKAYSAVQCGNYKESIQHYKKALELAPGCDLFLMSIGVGYAKLGEKAKGIQYLERAAQISPGNSRIRDNLNNVRRAAIETKHPPLTSTPQPSATRQCPHCGSSSLGELKVTLIATRAVNRTVRANRKFDVTQLYCQECRIVLNDDLHGDIARAYSGLGDVRSSFDIDRKVTEVMQGTHNLPEISDADVDNDFEDVRRVWRCLKVVTIPERDLQSTVSRLIRGYAQEGASDLMVERLDRNQNIFLQISFIFDDDTFQGVRIARKAGGSFAAYGLVSMYRFVDDVDHRDGYVVTFLDEGEVAEGMSTYEVIRILGEPYRKTTWAELMKDMKVLGLSADSPRWRDEFWLYKFDEFEYEITIRDGKVSSANKRNKIEPG